MGNTAITKFEDLFRADAFDDIVQELVTLRADPTNEATLLRVPTNEEWNVLSILCRSRKLTSEQVAHTRARLHMLWASQEAPRKCAASSLILALVCFLECAFGGTDLGSAAGRLANMVEFVSADELDIRLALNWAAKIASMTSPAMAFDAINIELGKLSVEREPLRTFVSALIMASYCCIVVNNRTGGAIRSFPKPDEAFFLHEERARSIGFHCLTLALQCRDVGTPNGVVDQLWATLQRFELETSLAAVEKCSCAAYPPPPVVRTWADVPNAFVGQAHAVREIGELLRAKREGLLPAGKPTVLALFGPSGHGKTELAKWIARTIHGCEDPEASKDLLILSMPQYSTQASIYSLLDPPSGIVGEGGLITSIANQPKMVIVADEFEKSSSVAINNLWLPAFETNGKLASGKDPTKRVPTKDVTFVLTMNLCDREILDGAAAYQNAGDDGRRELRERWSKLCGERLCELLGNNAFLPRISRLIPFVPFTQAELQQYCTLQIQAFQRHQLARGVEFYYSRQVVERLARGVRNFHSRNVQDALLRPMLKAADARADAVLVTVRTPHPIHDAADSGGANSGNNSNNSSSNPAACLLATIGADNIEALGGKDAERIASWARERRLEKLHAEFEARQQQEEQEEEKRRAAEDAKAATEAAEAAAAADAAATKKRKQQQQEQEQNAATSETKRRQQQQEEQQQRELQKEAEVRQRQLQQQPRLPDRQQQREENVELQFDRDLKLDPKLAHEMQHLRAENLRLKDHVRHLEALVHDLQKCLAIALLFSMACMLTLCFFVPLKVVLLTAILVCGAAYHFVTNFVDIVKAAFVGAWNLLGPKNSMALIVACLLYSGIIGGWYRAAPSCSCPEQ